MRRASLCVASAAWLVERTRNTLHIHAEARNEAGKIVVLAQSVDNLPRETLVQRFRDTRSVDYTALLREVAKAGRSAKGISPARLTRFRRLLGEIAAIDFFGSPARSRVEAAIEQAARSGVRAEGEPAMSTNKKEYQSRTWITRPRPKIDRVSSAWLIRRFIDPAATFGFIADAANAGQAIPYDMFGAEFSHHGDQCTFETLCRRFSIESGPIDRIARIVHDLDLKDGKYDGGSSKVQMLEFAS